jgi:hypothetical protein
VFFKPDILALFISSFLISGMVLYSCFYGALILKYWDIGSGSETQLRLERRTYLISTIIAYALAFQLLSLFLFIYTADNIHTFFTGAMCAVGSLNVNQWGFPVVFLKTAIFLLGGLWLVINYVDNQGYDYPLIKIKYIGLLCIAPFIIMEAIIQFKYFQGLKPEIIVSCCGSLFTADTKGVASELISFPMLLMEILFYASMTCSLILGVWFYRTGKTGYWLASSIFLTFIISIASLVSFISIYIYELPTHHCPFCFLQKEYGYIGYALYLLLMVGGLAGMSVGLLMPFRQVPSLKATLPAIQKHLALTSVTFYALFTLIATYYIIFSNLKM